MRLESLAFGIKRKAGTIARPTPSHPLLAPNRVPLLERKTLKKILRRKEVVTFAALIGREEPILVAVGGRVKIGGQPFFRGIGIGRVDGKRRG